MQLNQQGRTTTGAMTAPQFDSTSQQAAAQTVNTAVQSTLPLLERLNQFSGKAVQLGTQKMIQNAKEQAVVDVTNGDFSLSEEGTIYGMAYDGAAKTAYISDTTTNIKQNVSRIAAKNKYSPEGFIKDWDAQKSTYKKAALDVDQNGYVDAVVSDTAQQYGDAAYAKITAEFVTAQRNIQIKENEEALVLLEDEYISAMVSGNQDAIGATVSSMRATLGSMYNTQQIGVKGIETKWKILGKRVRKAVVKNEFGNKMAAGEGAEYISTFREKAKKSPNFKDATPTEINEMIDDMYSTLSKKHGFEDDQIKREEADKERKSIALKEDMDEAWLTGALTSQDVDTALSSGLITPAEHKTYSKKVFDKGAPFTDTSVELRVVQNMASLSVQDIMSIQPMTNEDKMKYIKQLRTYQASDEGKWTSTVQGRAAIEMLRNQYKIAQAGMLAGLTKEKDLKAYAKAYQSFIFEMEELDPAKRESYAMHYAQASIDLADAEALEKNKSVSDVVQTKRREALQGRIESYQRQVGKTKSAYYIKGLAEFADRFGETGDIKFNTVEWSK